MQYAFVTETWPPEVNGVALTVHGLMQDLRQRGHAVQVIRPRRDAHDMPQADEWLARGAKIPRYPGLRFGLPARRQLLQHWRRHRPDAVYIATEGPLGWSALQAARQLDIGIATGFHTRFDLYLHDYRGGWLAPLALCWMRKFHNQSSATVAPTRELAEALRVDGFHSVVHLPRAVDATRFHPDHRDAALRGSWGLSDNDLAVLYFGRVAAEKNLPLAIAAFRRIQCHRPDARFVWVGDGPELAAIARQHPDFVFCGLQRDADLARHVASCDLFLFPSLSETFGNVTIEAMASGVATVAFDYGAAKEHMVDRAHGATVARGDDGTFINAACHFAMHDVLRQQAGQAARMSMERLRPEQVAPDFDALLQRVAKAEHGHGRLAAA